MKVCIAEKPSVAKEIAEIVGASQRKDGYWEGNGYQVTWTFGHLCELKEPHEYDSAYREWNLNMLPILPMKFGIKLKKDKGVEKQFNTISTLFNNADEIINCGDAGQEGELIQRWVLAKSNCKKPMKRLWISSLTEEAIRDGFKKLKDAKDYDSLYFAGYSRAAADWLLGMNATRLYTIKYGNGNRQVLSVGRVQTPTLAMIVNRQVEINNFRSAVFFELKTKYRDVIFNAQIDRFYGDEKHKAEDLLNSLKNEEFVITTVETKKGKESSPRLFDLTSLQVECNKKFGYSADDTLKTIQNLYERKLVTYPRVDTTYLPDDMYPKIPGIMKQMVNYSGLVAPLLKEPIRKSGKVFDDKKVTDHHAIIPTDVKAQGLGGAEAQVYDVIAKRFIAAFYPDCEVSNTVVLGKVKEVDFKANGKQILDAGWRVVYSRETLEEDEKEDIQLLPEFVAGERGKHEAYLAEGKTSPPKAYTEATLLRAMETAGKQIEDEELRDLMKDNGIGRPSTRAAIIETLFRRNYIKRERKNLVPTVTGMELILTINNELLKSAEMTGNWEFKLRQIEKGEYQADAFLQEMKQMVSDLVLQVKNESGKRIAVESAETKSKSKADQKATCPKCKSGEMMKGKAAYGCSSFKNGCDFKIPFELMGRKLTDAQITALADKGKTPIIKGFLMGESKKDGILKLTSSFNIEFEEKEAAAPKVKKEAAGIVCPKCKSGNILKGNSAYGCSNWKSGCVIRFPFEFLGKSVTETHIQALSKKGETSEIKGFVKDGSKVNGKLKFNERFEIILS
ncbi:MAG: topoisomerase [Bacteroidetes bacterium]|jgi:DNA topoisomerase-3|nr:topoisomerase [Bacteroidota bacterium]